MTEPPLDKSATPGVHRKNNTLEFSLFSARAHSVFLHLFLPLSKESVKRIPMIKDSRSIWRVEIALLAPDTEYLFEVDREMVFDPYAKILSTPHRWGEWSRPARCQLSFDHVYDWEGDRPPRHPPEDAIIYEMHVRGFTKDPSSKVAHPGTYAGVIEKIPYLKQLGINVIELMPIYEFDERENPFHSPTGKRLWNYWGYAPLNLFAPMRRYATSGKRLDVMKEFKDFIKACHKADIEVILDVVYNHMSTQSGLSEIDPANYFILDPDGSHTNYTGCGNTINANSAASRELILTSLRYFVEEYHIDGFRFDLGAILVRDASHEPLSAPPFFEALEQDPILSHVKLIAEPWDASGLNIIGHFPCNHMSAWNGDFRYIARKFWHGEKGQEGLLFDSLLGSKRIFGDKRSPLYGINYVGSHDGFSLLDSVCYTHKQNLANGESNRDGENNNCSCNYGIEGKSEDPVIKALRLKEVEHLLLTNFIALGIPMITMGDEYGLTHEGNNNPYCHDGPLNWFSWDTQERNQNYFSRATRIIALRNKLPLLRSPTFYNHAQDIQWLTIQDHFLSYVIKNQYLIAFNASHESRTLDFLLTSEWVPLFYTADILETEHITLPGQSALIAIKK